MWCPQATVGCFLEVQKSQGHPLSAPLASFSLPFSYLSHQGSLISAILEADDHPGNKAMETRSLSIVFHPSFPTSAALVHSDKSVNSGRWILKIILSKVQRLALRTTYFHVHFRCAPQEYELSWASQNIFLLWRTRRTFVKANAQVCNSSLPHGSRYLSMAPKCHLSKLARVSHSMSWQLQCHPHLHIHKSILQISSYTTWKSGTNRGHSLD